METTGEMNWQLLIKMVSFSFPRRSPAFDSLFGSWKIEREPEELAPFCCARGLRASERSGGAMEVWGARDRRAARTRLAFFLFMPTIHHR